MLRSLTSRRFLGIALAAGAGAGIGLVAAGLASASGASTPQHLPVAAAATAAPWPVRPVGPAAPATSPAPQSGSTALTLDQAKTVATKAAPGNVVEWSQDTEPTGLVYDVTVLHADGTDTKVEVDAATGNILSLKHDNDRWDG